MRIFTKPLILTAVVMLFAILAGCSTAPTQVPVYRDRLVPVTVPETYYVTEDAPAPPQKAEYMALTDKQREARLAAYAMELQLYAHGLRKRIDAIFKASREIKQRIEESN